MATSGAASASCWQGRLCNILFKFAVTGISGSNPERVPGHIPLAVNDLTGNTAVDHILYECKLLEHDKDRLKAAVIRSENWPVSKDKLSIKFYKKISKNSRTTYY